MEEKLTVGDIMTVAPRSISTEWLLRDAAAVMREEGIRHLPVVDPNSDEIVGILTDRDVRSARHTPFFDIASVESCMTPDPITVTPDMPLRPAAEILLLYKFGSLPVVSGRHVVGIVTVSDFLRHIGREEADQDSSQKSHFWQQFGQQE